VAFHLVGALCGCLFCCVLAPALALLYWGACRFSLGPHWQRIAMVQQTAAPTSSASSVAPSCVPPEGSSAVRRLMVALHELVKELGPWYPLTP
jgi:hypothetical protein